MSLTRDDLKAALGDAQIAAFLHVIREGESSQNDDAYTLINGGGHFASFADHPFAGQPAPPGKAAGAYQFIPHTWEGLAQRYGFTNFSPQCQDEGAVALCLEQHAGDAIKAGQIADACSILASTWVSLPGLGTARAERAFVKFGGTLPVTQPQDQGTTMDDQTTSPLSGSTAATAIPDIIAGVAPFLGPWGVVVGGLVKAFSPLFQEKLAKEIGKHTDSPDTAQQIAASVVQVAQDVTGKDDPVQATAAVQNDPQMAAKVEETLSDRLTAIAPYIDKLGELDKARWSAEIAGRDAAAARAQHERWDMTPVVVWFAAVTTTLLVFGLAGAIVYQAVTKDGTVSGVLIGLAGPLMMAAIQCWRDIFGYRFDGSKVSEAQTAVLQQMASK